MAAVHHLQDAVVPRLEGQVEDGGHFLAPGHGLKQLVGGVLGVRGHESNEKISRNVVDGGQQVREVHGLGQVLAIGVHVLAQEGDVFIALLYQAPHLVQDVLRCAGALPAPDIGHDAIGAEVVAAIHDGHPGLDAVLADGGDTLGDGPGLVGHREDASPLGEQGVDHLRELPQGVGAEDQVHVAIGLADLLGHMLLLHHAAAQTDELLRVAALGVDQSPHVAQHPLLGVLPDGAGVDDDDAGLLRVIGKTKAHPLQIAPDAL